MTVPISDNREHQSTADAAEERSLRHCIERSQIATINFHLLIKNNNKKKKEKIESNF